MADYHLSDPHLIGCGEPPKPGERVWRGDQAGMVGTSGEFVPVTASVVPVLRHARVVEALFCHACLLPKFVPGHGLRGCKSGGRA